MKSAATAALFHGPSLPFEIRPVELPQPGPGETLVRIVCATVCGSDIHTIRGRRRGHTPVILGHEMVGEVVATGAGGVRDFRGRELEVGARVTWSMVWSCGDCEMCRLGVRPKCERLFKFGHERFDGAGGLTGAYATHCHLRAGTAIYRVAAEIPDAVAATANCAGATVAAAIRRAGPLRGARVLVAGVGMLGMTACAMAAEAGAREVIAMDRDAERAERALRFGATRAAIAGEDRLCGVDVAFDFCGEPEAIEGALATLRPGGELVLAGAVYPARALAVSAEDVTRRLLRITGVYNYSPEDLEAALEFLAAAVGRYPFSELVGGRFALERINEAMEFVQATRPYRVAIFPE